MNRRIAWRVAKATKRRETAGEKRREKEAEREAGRGVGGLVVARRLVHISTFVT